MILLPGLHDYLADTERRRYNQANDRIQADQQQPNTGRRLTDLPQCPVPQSCLPFFAEPLPDDNYDSAESSAPNSSRDRPPPTRIKITPRHQDHTEDHEQHKVDPDE